MEIKTVNDIFLAERDSQVPNLQCNETEVSKLEKSAVTYDTDIE